MTQPRTLSIRVIPNAARSEIVGFVGEVLKVKLQAVPEDGKANRALCELLAQHCNCRAREIRILNGEKSRLKTIELPSLEGLKAFDLPE